MSSNSIYELREKVRRIQRRRVRLLNLREICLGVVCMAALFAALGLLEMKFQLPPAGRIALTGILAAAAGALVWRYLHLHRQLASDDRRIAHYVDEQIPELEQRLMTSLEFDGKRSTGDTAALVQRLWQDTRMRLRGLDMAPVSSIRSAWYAAAGALLVLGGLFFAGWSLNDFLPAGIRVLMPWVQSVETTALPVGLSVAPGNIKIQRGNDVLLVARTTNVVPEKAEVYLLTGSESWDRVPMRQEGAENTFAHFLAAIQKDVTYYVDIGVKRSERYTISVLDMPRVERIAVDYVYPEHTGLKNRTIEDGGDVIAPEGTRITLHPVFNKAVHRAAVHFGDGTTLDLAVDGTTARGSFIVARDVTYTIKVLDSERLANEDPYVYFVRSVADGPPAVTLIRPGRDRRVMSLEEVSIAAAAEDDYGLAGFALNYNVAGGENREIDFLAMQKEPSNASIHSKTTLYLEDLNVTAGDFVFYYLTARDNNRLKGAAEIVSDIYFLEVVPTEAAFRRGPQGAGGGGGQGGGRGQASSALVENQKNIIAATWKLLKQHRETDPDEFKANVATITDSQRQVMQRAQMSLQRLSERFSFSDDSYQRAVNHLQEAVGHMAAAIENLTSRRLQKALGPEQSALQAIMKAEAESRNTMIQMAQNRGSGGAGGPNREREDLKKLFEMEMGRLENRYEIPKQTAAARQARENNDTLEKLRELARRQERLNRAQKDHARRRDQMDEQQRKRRLEELRREQEKLRQDAQELSRRMSRLARGDGLRQWSDRQRQLAEAARRMQEAERDLRARQPATALTKGQQASKQLRDQEREMRLDRQATMSNLVNDLRRKGRALQRQEQEISQKLQALKSEMDLESPPAATRAIRLTKDLLTDKDRLQQELTEAESMLKTLGSKGRADHPQIAQRARETLQALQSEAVEKRIEQSRRMLEAGWLTLSLDTEKKIEQSIERVGAKLQNLDRPAAPSRDEQIRQAAADAGGLRQELENLQREIAALQQSKASRQQGLSGPEPQAGRLQTGPGDEAGGRQARMQQHLHRSRRYAKGLVQPWARGERWGIDARSIQRELTQKEIEDFLRQPDLWQRLLEPVRELESTLLAQAKGNQLKKKIFAVPEETVPPAYRDKVEEYYRELSQAE